MNIILVIYQMKPLLVILGDSRLAKFNSFQDKFGPSDKYETLVWYQAGGKISDLHKFIAEVKSKHCAAYPHRKALFIIAVGINNFTRRIYNDRNESELIADRSVKPENIWAELSSLKAETQTVFETAVVIICSIPPVIYEKYNDFRGSKGKLTLPTISKLESKNNTDYTLEQLKIVNREISRANHEGQSGIRTKHISLHANCLTSKKDKNQNKYMQLIPGALYDGLHPQRATGLNWFHKIHKCAKFIVEQF